MIVKNKTKISCEEAIDDLTRLAKKDYSSRYLLTIICLICGIFLLVLGLTNNDTQTITFGSIFMAIGIAYGVFTAIQYSKCGKKIAKESSEAMKDGISFEFTFKEQSTNIIITQGQKKSKADYSYYDFKKIEETPDSYEFRVNDNIIIAKKSGFENKKMEEQFVRNVQKNKKVKLKLLKKKNN